MGFTYQFRNPLVPIWLNLSLMKERDAEGGLFQLLGTLLVNRLVVPGPKRTSLGSNLVLWYATVPVRSRELVPVGMYRRCCTAGRPGR
eukprot:SAG31_NODE_4875_length_2891_cov_2.693052_3_plen_88_part_00